MILNEEFKDLEHLVQKHKIKSKVEVKEQNQSESDHSPASVAPEAVKKVKVTAVVEEPSKKQIIKEIRVIITQGT